MFRPLAAAVVAAALVPAASAQAATTYYTSPNAGLGDTACSQAQPCLLGYALENKGTVGDTISVAAGYYSIVADTATHAGVKIVAPRHGAAMLVNSSAGGQPIRLDLAQGASLTGLYLKNIDVHFGQSTSAEAIQVRALRTACAVDAADVTIVGSLCQGSEGGSAAVWPSVAVAPAMGNGTVTLRNDTIFGTRRALSVNVAASGETVKVVNTIARTADTSNCPIQLTGPNDGVHHVDVELHNVNSAAVLTGAGQCGGDGFAVHLTQVTPQSSDPALANAVDDLLSGDFHETDASPTRGAGDSTGIPMGELDDDDDRRLLGPANSLRTDIGWDERVTAPTVVDGAATGVTGTTATLNATVDGKGLDSSTTFEYGIASADENPLDAINEPASLAGQPLSAPLTGLTPGTTYRWKACTLAGQQASCGAEGTFTTSAAASGGGASGGGGSSSSGGGASTTSAASGDPAPDAPAGTRPAPAPPAGPLVAPSIRLAGGTLTVLAGGRSLKLSATCTAATGRSCRVSGTLAHGLGRFTGTIAAGHAGRLRVTLSRSARRKLRSTHRLGLTLAGVVSDGTGASTPVRGRLVLRVHRKHG